jgi:dihydroneopterin aldolase/2-amino-4-hydroxy-6-hydroxymethyldihydropteridine diphosphokinase
MDQIYIKNLEVFANHGVYPEENKLGQKFIINVRLDVNLRAAGCQDDLNKTINYGEICHEIATFLTKQTFKLLEGAAEQLARHLLLHTPRLSHVEVEIKKPWAPVGLPLETVAVKINRGWHRAYLSVGSNLGDRKQMIAAAIEKLGQNEDCRVEQVSGFYETKPYGDVPQPDFINGCVIVATILEPSELLAIMQQLEQLAGRERTVRWGPRTLDLDMLYYDDLITEEPELILPHPDLHNRKFVLEPLLELAPLHRHPVSKKTTREMLKEIEA